MRRLLLLSLMFVLLAQFSWAVVHGYAHDAQAHESDVSVVAAVEDSSEHSDASHAGHECCTTGHSCHGSPLLLAGQATGIAAVSASALHGVSERLKLFDLASRHERPQWVAA